MCFAGFAGFAPVEPENGTCLLGTLGEIWGVLTLERAGTGIGGALGCWICVGMMGRVMIIYVVLFIITGLKTGRDGTGDASMI